MLPVLLVVLAFGMWALTAVGAQLRCTDAAGLAARAAARGDDPASVQSVARTVAPDGARVEVSRSGGRVLVVVRAEVGALGGVLGGLPGVDVAGRAVAMDEQALP